LRFRALAVTTALCVYAQIVLGGAVRVTGSGMGCPDWPLCHGRLLPRLEYHTLIEYLHRSFGSLAIILVLATAAAAIVQYRRAGVDTSHARGKLLAAAASLTFLLIVVQAVLGGITVLLHNNSAAVWLHLGNALLVLACASAVALWAGQPQATHAPRSGSRQAAAGFPTLVYTTLVATYASVLSGAYVVDAGASAACPSWPLCGSTGFTPPAGIHMLHRALVLLAGALLLVSAYVGRRHWRGSAMVSVAYGTAILLLAEVMVGYFQVALHLPAILRAIHLAVATAIWAGAALMATSVWLETRVDPRSRQLGEPHLSGVDAG
jgi:heme A synthase